MRRRCLYQFQRGIHLPQRILGLSSSQLSRQSLESRSLVMSEVLVWMWRDRHEEWSSVLPRCEPGHHRRRVTYRGVSQGVPGFPRFIPRTILLPRRRNRQDHRCRLPALHRGLRPRHQTIHHHRTIHRQARLHSQPRPQHPNPCPWRHFMSVCQKMWQILGNGVRRNFRPHHNLLQTWNLP